MNETPQEISRAARTDWLANLKPGDEFVVRTGWLKHWYISKVERLTATQIISLDQDGRERRYGRKHGREIGERGVADRIEPATDDARSKILRNKLATEFCRYNWMEFTTSQLVKIDALVESFRTDP